jgi:hypothetical protein
MPYRCLSGVVGLQHLLTRPMTPVPAIDDDHATPTHLRSRIAAIFHGRGPGLGYRRGPSKFSREFFISPSIIPS